MTTSHIPVARRSRQRRPCQPAQAHLTRRQAGELAYHRLEELGVDAWVQIARRNGEPVHGRYKKRVGDIIWLKWGAGYWAVNITDMLAVSRLPDPAALRHSAHAA